MICDKCGFEHNSRSVCPKCGARVVYVDEDYLRRRREWEEAQKNPEKKDQLLSGIMHSTREDYDRRHGNDTVTKLNDSFLEGDGKNDREKGRSGMTGLSFDVIKEKIENAILGAAEKLAAFIRRHKKRRGADNPVIREIKFDDAPDDVDNSPAVLEHKVFHRVRKPVVLAGICIAGCAVAAVISVNIVKAVRNRDRSRIFVYDGTAGYFADDTENPVITSENEGFTVDYDNDGYMLAHDEKSIMIFKDGRMKSISAGKPSIVAWSRELDTVVYTEKGKTMITDGKETGELTFDEEPEINGECGYTESCMISGDGSYIFLVTCENTEDTSTGTQTIYFGTAADGMKKTYEGPDVINVTGVSDSGLAVYEDMKSAAYGVVTGRRLMKLENGSASVINDDIQSSVYDYINDAVYYIDDKGVLSVSGNVTADVTDGVYEIMLPTLTKYRGGAVFRTDDGYLYTSGKSDENGTVSCEPVYSGNGKIQAGIGSDGAVYCYDGTDVYKNREKAASDVSYVRFFEDDTFLWQSGEKLSFSNDDGTYELSGKISGAGDAYKTGKTLYVSDSTNELYSSDLKGKKTCDLGRAEFITKIR